MFEKAVLLEWVRQQSEFGVFFWRSKLFSDGTVSNRNLESKSKSKQDHLREAKSANTQSAQCHPKSCIIILTSRGKHSIF